MAASGDSGGREAQRLIFFEPRAKQRLTDDVWPALATHGTGGLPPIKSVGRPSHSVQTLPDVEATVGPCAVKSAPDIRTFVDSVETDGLPARVLLVLVCWFDGSSSKLKKYWTAQGYSSLESAYASVGVKFSAEGRWTREGKAAMERQWSEFQARYTGSHGYPTAYRVCYARRLPGAPAPLISRVQRAFAENHDISTRGGSWGYLWSAAEMAEFNLPHGLGAESVIDEHDAAETAESNLPPHGIDTESGIVHDVAQGTVYDVPGMSEATRRAIRLATQNGFALIGLTAPRWTRYTLLSSIVLDSDGLEEEQLVVGDCVYLAEARFHYYNWVDSWGRTRSETFIDGYTSLGWYLAGDPESGLPYQLDSEGNQVGGTPESLGLPGAYAAHSEDRGTKTYGDDTDSYTSFERMFYPDGLQESPRPMFRNITLDGIVDVPDHRYDKSYDWSREIVQP